MFLPSRLLPSRLCSVCCYLFDSKRWRRGSARAHTLCASTKHRRLFISVALQWLCVVCFCLWNVDEWVAEIFGDSKHHKTCRRARSFYHEIFVSNEGAIVWLFQQFGSGWVFLFVPVVLDEQAMRWCIRIVWMANLLVHWEITDKSLFTVINSFLPSSQILLMFANYGIFAVGILC